MEIFAKIFIGSTLIVGVALAINSSIEKREFIENSFNAGKSIVCGQTTYNKNDSVLEGGMIVKYGSEKGMLSKHVALAFAQTDMCQVQ